MGTHTRCSDALPCFSPHRQIRHAHPRPSTHIPAAGYWRVFTRLAKLEICLHLPVIGRLQLLQVSSGKFVISGLLSATLRSEGHRLNTEALIALLLDSHLWLRASRATLDVASRAFCSASSPQAALPANTRGVLATTGRFSVIRHQSGKPWLVTPLATPPCFPCAPLLGDSLADLNLSHNAEAERQITSDQSAKAQQQRTV